jgi:tRNA (cmo5U34)-methyltransferase
MAVASHLNIDLAEYDQRIRTFIPRYEEMLDVAADALLVLERPDPIIVELGMGTGALAARVLARKPAATIIGVDADAEILKFAQARLAPLTASLRTVVGSFTEVALERCDVVMSSFALHHVPDRASKTRMYAKIFDALSPGGMLVSADNFLNTDPRFAETDTRAWRAHLEQFYTPDETTGYFQAWASEDVYVPLDDERAMMAAAGFTVDVLWRHRNHAVVAAIRSAA